jgi:hypothetical protein
MRTPRLLAIAERPDYGGASNGFVGKALKLNGLGAFLLADYPYQLGYGAVKPQFMMVSDAGHSRSDKPAAYADSDGDTLCESFPGLKMLGSETAQ